MRNSTACVFFNRVIDYEQTDPQLYVNECSNGIFSLLKKEYDTPRNRALSATARLKQMPQLLEQGKQNLIRPVRLYAQLAMDSARSIDSLFNESLMTLATDLSPAERADLVKSRDVAVVALHGFADWLERRLPGMVPFKPMGEENYNYILKNIYLLPLDAKQVDMLGQGELARYRGLESMLADPAMADPNPARSKNIPADQQAFLKAYESRQEEMIGFLKTNRLVTIPDYIGPFHDSPVAGSVQAHEPGWVHESSGRLRQRQQRFLFHSDLQSDEQEFLYSRRD